MYSKYRCTCSSRTIEKAVTLELWFLLTIAIVSLTSLRNSLRIMESFLTFGVSHMQEAGLMLAEAHGEGRPITHAKQEDLNL